MSGRAIGRTVAAVLAGALLLSALIGYVVQPSLVDAARAACVARGWKVDELTVKSYRETGRLYSRRGVVQFWTPAGQAGKVVRVDMSRPVHAFGWKLTDIQEVNPGE